MPPRKPAPTRPASAKLASAGPGSGKPAPAQNRGDALARLLAADILDGRSPVGALLPGDADLAARHRVSLAMARGAVRQLEALGLVTRSRGAPARVISGELRATYLVMPNGGETTESGYLGVTRLGLERQRPVTADAELAVLLGVNEGTAWLHLTGLRLPPDASFGPLSWVDIWLAGSAASVPAGCDFTRAEIEALTGAGIGQVHEEVSAGLLTPAQARLLRARGGTAALHLLRRYLRGAGALVAAVRDVHPADRITVSIRGRA